MKHYYSIANFAVGIITKAYDYLNAQYDYYTYQHLFGMITSYSQGNSDEVTLKNLAQGIVPANFPYTFSGNTLQYVAGEFLHYIENTVHSHDWDGDLRSGVITNTTTFQVVSDWSTATTIGAEILDVIDYYTNYNFSSWNSTGFPNIVMQNIKESYEFFVKEIDKVSLDYHYGLPELMLKAVCPAALVMMMFMLALNEPVAKVALVGLVGLGVAPIAIAALGIMTVPFTLATKVSFDIVATLIPFALPTYSIENLVKKLGIESIKPLRDAGADFSYLSKEQIQNLVEKYGVEIKDKLLHPENIQAEIIADDIYIESLVDNSMGQIKKDEHLDYSITMEIESAYTTAYDTYTFEAISAN